MALKGSNVCVFVCPILSSFVVYLSLSLSLTAIPYKSILFARLGSQNVIVRLDPIRSALIISSPPKWWLQRELVTCIEYDDHTMIGSVNVPHSQLWHLVIKWLPAALKTLSLSSLLLLLLLRKYWPPFLLPFGVVALAAPGEAFF